MTSKIPTITEVKNSDETNKWLLIWQGLTDTWTKLVEAVQRQDEMDVDVKKHEQILITGKDDQPSILERVRNLERFVDKFEYWARFVGGTIILQTIAFFVGIIVAILKFLPLLERLASKP